MCHYCPSSQNIDHRGRLEFIVTSNPAVRIHFINKHNIQKL